MKLSDSTLDFIDRYQAQAEEHLRRSIESIDRVMGDGVARENPALIAAFMHTMASNTVGYSLDYIAGSIREISPQ